jgi:hypothetical protein
MIRWRSRGQDWAYLIPLPAVNRGFSELRTVEFEKPEAGWSLLIDDEPAETVPSNEAYWTWTPGFFAGEVRAELIRVDGRCECAYALDVSPDDRKMGRTVFDEMLNELWDADPELVLGSEPATMPIGELGAFDSPALAFARLKRYGNEFISALGPVCARPRRTLKSDRDLVPLQQVRRLDRRTALALLRSPMGIRLVTDPEHPAVEAVRLDVPMVDDTVDCAPNRAMMAMILAVRQRARSVSDALRAGAERKEDSETRTSLSSRWPARKAFLDQLVSGVTRVLRQFPFTALKRPEVTAAGLTAIAADPGYARAWGRGWRALRHGVEDRPTDERLWLSPSWEIYERWCFLRVGESLKKSFPDWRWTYKPRHRTYEGSVEGRKAFLRLQPTFSSADAPTHGPWSVSKTREPDLVLTVQAEGQTRFVVLDAKYRTTHDNVLDAMTSAHVYQDSLRIDTHRPEASLLLVPAGGGAPWLEEYSFCSSHRVGVHVLAPDGVGDLPRLVKELLSLSGTGV